MSKSDAEIGREAVERYVRISMDGENDTDDEDYAVLTHHIREAIRPEIEREALGKLLEQARREAVHDPGMQDTVNWISSRLVAWQGMAGLPAEE